MTAAPILLSTTVFNQTSAEGEQRIRSLGFSRQRFITEHTYIAQVWKDQFGPGDEWKKKLAEIPKPQRLDEVVLDYSLIADEMMAIPPMDKLGNDEDEDHVVCLNYEDCHALLDWQAKDDDKRRYALGMHAGVVGTAQAYLTPSRIFGTWGTAKCRRGGKHTISSWRNVAARMCQCAHISGYFNNHNVEEWSWLKAQVANGLQWPYVRLHLYHRSQKHHILLNPDILSKQASMFKQMVGEFGHPDAGIVFWAMDKWGVMKGQPQHEIDQTFFDACKAIRDGITG